MFCLCYKLTSEWCKKELVTIELESSVSHKIGPALQPFLSLTGSGHFGLVNDLHVCALLVATLSTWLANRYKKCRHKNSPLKTKETKPKKHSTGLLSKTNHYMNTLDFHEYSQGLLDPGHRLSLDVNQLDVGLSSPAFQMAWLGCVAEEPEPIQPRKAPSREPSANTLLVFKWLFFNGELFPHRAVWNNL